MFKKFDEKENVSNCIQLKTSVIKGIKNQLIDQFPVIEPWLNQIMPKKDPVKIVRCHEHIEILTVNGELLFFRQREGIFYPTLRLLHKYPFILPHQQVDKGAIKFVLSGANIMCPGLTSPGAKLYPAAVDTVVGVPTCRILACCANLAEPLGKFVYLTSDPPALQLNILFL
ncbi:hypothetical protein HGM15179_012294 [Zosterops borbonicus]|uniref:Pre-PUA domain-containing protein n=1 Tax=Zosterops borbonicus TaxID=364589 RepID=A0A8K1GBC3_9PASS|nr:hypothetical protein HGM15179_012294 [Zosterops borbonicus]